MTAKNEIEVAQVKIKLQVIVCWLLLVAIDIKTDLPMWVTVPALMAALVVGRYLMLKHREAKQMAMEQQS